MAVRKQKSIEKFTKPKLRKKPVKKDLVSKRVVSSVSKSVSNTSVKTKLSTKTNSAVPTKASKPRLTDAGHTTHKELSLSLPLNMSKRAVEKSIVLAKEFDHYFGRSMYRIAYVSSICFILVGVSLITTQANFPEVSRLMTGEVISSTSHTSTTGDTLTSPDYSTTGDTSTTSTTAKTSNTFNDQPTVPIAADPTFSVIEEIPPQLDELFRFLFIVTDAIEVIPVLMEVGESNSKTLNIESLIDSKYRVDIPAASIPPGFYKIKIIAKPANGSTNKVFITKEFHVGPIEVAPVSEDTIVTLSDGKATQTEEIDATTTTESNLVEITTQDEEIQATEVIFSITTPNETTLHGTSIINISAPDEYSYIELYARPVQSLTSRFITLATKRLDKWIFVVNSENIPNGKYEFLAKTKYEGKMYETKPVIVYVKNTPLVQISNSTESASDTELKNEDDNQEPERPLISIENEVFVPLNVVNDDAERETKKLIDENLAEINILFEKYAVAQQSGDQILIDAASKALQEKRESIVFYTLQSERLRDISDDIDKSLEERINDFKERVVTFEQIRSNKSSGKTAEDYDKDGISDYDESNLYNTNPNSADTDNDGFTDGIEIIRGFDPLDDSAEAVIKFESPKESLGLVREESLRVEGISPVIQITSGEEDTAPVGAEIRGIGLPDSFITLFIFSTPTVVTIKTDADGSFVYTFDKELEDGQHDVYVAVTDNAGKIIAQSNPFSFIKRAEAFTPVDAAEAEVITTETITDSSGGTYNTVVGIGILALGIILLMLGISLRTKDEEPNKYDSDKVVTNKDGSKKDATKFEHINAS